MLRVKEEALQYYMEECLRQTMPYRYENGYINRTLKYTQPEEQCSGTVVYFPNDDGNILNFEGINTEYIVFISTEGKAEPDIVDRLLSEADDADIIYCDEDFINNINANLKSVKERMDNLRTPWRKPDYSPDTLLSFPYIETCFAIKTKFARTVPAIKKSPEISDNVRIWDFLLRATERSNKITHVTKTLYHRDVKSFAGYDKAPFEYTDEEIYRALIDRYERPGYQLCREAAQKRRGLDVLPVLVEGGLDANKKTPVVTIVIPSKDNPEMLCDCLDNIRLNAGSTAYDVIIVDNGSNEENTGRIKAYLNKMPKDRYTYIHEQFDFDFSKMCNMGAEKSQTPYLLFLNDDVDVITDKFLEKLLKYASQSYIGAVGAKLLYPEDKKIQHVGITDIKKGPTHKLMTLSDDNVHYYGRNRYAWNVLAVTGACLMVSREKFFQAGGFSDKMKVGYNDVDLCVKLFENGYFNVVNNECIMIHKESVSRGKDIESYAKVVRLKKERHAFYEAHPWLKEGHDPFYNPYLDTDTIEYRPAVDIEYQRTDFRNSTMPLNRLPARVSEHVHFNIDRCYSEWGIADDAQDAYCFDGWSLCDNYDNVYSKRYMVFVPLDEEGRNEKECIAASVSPKYRTDIKEVFPDMKNIFLAGFVCRIPMDALDPAKKYRIGVYIKKMGIIGSYKLAFGGIYEPGRGITQDN